MIFVDSGAFIARVVVRDQHHQAAMRLWTRIQQSDVRCITTNVVLSESLTLIARATTYEFAATQARELYASRALEIERPDFRDEVEAINLFSKYSDQRVSFADCLSFAVMKRRSVRDVLGFDSDFELAGFRLLR